MRKAILFLVIFLVLLAAPSVVRYLQYYQPGSSEPAPPPVYDPAAIAAVPTPAANLAVDEPLPGRGLVLLDRAHDNQFDLREISYLDSRLSARGYELVPFDSGDLASALRSVNAFVAIAPVVDYTADEILAVSRFVERGGRVLLVGDPTRYRVEAVEDEIFGLMFELDTSQIPLNGLANAFDMSFNGDYLYNTAESEGNFQNILVPQRGVVAGSLADGLEQLALYGAHSLTAGPTATAVLTGDDNTWSSATDRPGGLVLAASSADGRVFAIGDLQFMMDPYYTVYDNSQLIVRLADFLADDSGRGLVLGDFPYFFNTAVNLVYAGAPELGPDAFDEIIDLQDAFRSVGGDLNLVGKADPERDMFYAGIYNQAGELEEMLADAGVTLVIDPPVEAPGAADMPASEASEGPPEADEAAGEETSPEPEPDVTRVIVSDFGTVQMSGTALILLEEREGRRNLIVLAASYDGLESTFHRLIDLVPFNADYALSNCLLEETLALCPTGVVDEPVEAVMDTSGTPETRPEEEAAEGDRGGGREPVELDATDRGPITLGETVEGTLEPDETHAWQFSEGPLYIDIVAESGADTDVVLQVLDPDGVMIASSDSGVSEEDERITGLEIPDESVYTIVVRDFFDDGGSYTLTVTEGEPSRLGGDGVFIYSDDDGTPLADGFTSALELAAVLDQRLAVTIWSATDDGSLEQGQLDSFDLVIWDSGDYRDEEGFLSEDATVILDYLNLGGDLLIVGASPSLFGPIDLAPISEIVVAEGGEPLTDGLEPGATIALEQEIDAALTDLLETSGPDALSFFLRGAGDEGEGNVVGFAAIDATLNGQRTAFLFVPYTLLPAEVQTTLLENLIGWFGL